MLYKLTFRSFFENSCLKKTILKCPGNGTLYLEQNSVTVFLEVFNLLTFSTEHKVRKLKVFPSSHERV